MELIKKTLYTILCLCVMVNFVYLGQLRNTNVELAAASESYRIQTVVLQGEIEDLKQVKKTFIPMVVKATGYAPLDPRAVEGMCYWGDPRITASRAPSNPSRTVAMGPSIPYGTQVYIPGIGYRVVEDRGGAIKDDCIDIMFRTQEEAFTFGVQENKVIFIQPWK